MEVICYFIFGFIVSLINWFIIMTIKEKEYLNICIVFVLSFFLWPGVCIGWIYKLIERVNGIF